MPSKKPRPPDIQQTAIGDGNVQIVGDQNVVNQTITQRIVNVFRGDTEAQRAMRNRRAMLELVKNTWIKGVLEKSLYNEVLIELGMEERPDAVDHPWDVQVQMPDKENRRLPADTSMMEVFDEMNGAMLILGEPGSGKTTMLLELARDCIERAQQDDNQPVPVIFNLSSWDGKQTIDDWLVNELRTKYNVPKKTAESWVSNDELQLLLDGLDEVKLENREACVKAINDFRQRHGLVTPIVVCSRIDDYEALTARLDLSGAIHLQALTPEQIETYFAQAGPELDRAHQMIKSDIALQELAKQPLILSIMALAYQGQPAEKFEGEPASSMESRRKHLFDTYIQQMFARVARTKNEIYTPEQTKRWLTWLAQKMYEQSQVQYFFENMQPVWLGKKKLIRLYQILVGLFTGLFVGLVGGLVVGLSGSLVSGLDFSSLYTPIWSWENARQGMEVWLNIGIIIGGGMGLLVVLGSGLEIKIVDAITWSWDNAKKGLRKGLIVCVIVSIILGILLDLADVWLNGEPIDLGFIMFVSLSLFVMFGIVLLPLTTLWYGLVGNQLVETSLPGEKIELSVKSAVFSFVVTGLGTFVVFEMLTTLIGLILFGVSIMFVFFLSIGLSLVWLIGILYGLQNGGLAVIKILTLRLFLFNQKLLPWHLISFLDYCVDRIFLRRVGGGYIFVHRLLMEHFAAMYTEENSTK